jgi:hypothetical protein
MGKWAELEELIASGIIVQTGEKNSRKFVRLKELDPDAKLKEVDVYDLSDDAVVIKIDQKDKTDSIFKGNRGEKKRCDYAIFTLIGDKGIILFIEIKSGTIKKSKIEDQFKGGLCVLAYIEETLNQFFDRSNYFQDCERFFVVFYRKNIDKKPTRPEKPKKKNDTPRDFFRCASTSNPSIKSLILLDN